MTQMNAARVTLSSSKCERAPRKASDETPGLGSRYEFIPGFTRDSSPTCRSSLLVGYLLLSLSWDRQAAGHVSFSTNRIAHVRRAATAKTISSVRLLGPQR